MEGKKHILFIQPIFAPDKLRYERNLNSVLSLVKYMSLYKSKDIQITFAFGGYAMNSEYWQNIIDVINNGFNPDSLFIYRYDNNYGKAFIVNDIANAKLVHYDYDTIISCDSDMIFTPEATNIFDRLYNAANAFSAHIKKCWGVMALNQLENGCHLSNVHANKYSFLSEVNKTLTYHEEIHWPNEPSGIAGGCLFINRSMWKAIQGYRLMGVYAGDDAYILIDCQKAGYSNSVAISIPVIHPHENDPAYSKWKYDTAQRETASGIKTDISKQINDANNFWRGRE